MLSLRRASANDLPSLLSLLTRYNAEWHLGNRDTAATIAPELEHATLGFYLAEQHGAPVGCVLGQPLPAIPGAAVCKRLFVVPEARGEGIASRLLHLLEADVRSAGFHWLYLDTREEFNDAMRLYDYLGYTSCERFHDDPLATLFFRKHLL